MRHQVTPITLYPIPFNQRLPGGRRDRSPIERLLPHAVRAELLRAGWMVEDATHDSCVLRKRVDGFEAKVYAVHVRRFDANFVEARGELTLHSMPCGCTHLTLAKSDRLGEQLWPVLDATEALTVFGDESELDG